MGVFTAWFWYSIDILRESTFETSHDFPFHIVNGELLEIHPQLS
jgi:hypothetical protein